MPLDPTGLESDINAIVNPATQAAAAQDWADAMDSYAGGIFPASTTVSAAAATLKTAMEGAFALFDPVSTAAALESAFAAFAGTVSGGMAPAFTGTPPPAPVGFTPLVTNIQPDKATASALWATTIDTWMKTGLAQVAGGPPPPPVPWS